MYLTDKKNGKEREGHEDLEVLLESFSKQVEEIVNEAETIEVSLSHTFSLEKISDLFFRVMCNRLQK